MSTRVGTTLIFCRCFPPESDRMSKYRLDLFAAFDPVYCHVVHYWAGTSRLVVTGVSYSSIMHILSVYDTTLLMYSIIY